MKRILAVAVGPANPKFPQGYPITTQNPTNVRPYVNGLIDGLAPKKIGQDYDIWYRECPMAAINAATFGPGSDNKPNDLIFPMSTRVLATAVNSGITTSTVFPTGSNIQIDVRNNPPQNVAGLNARRDRGTELLSYFFQGLPSLRTLYYLHLTGYGPSERAKAGIQGVAAQNHITLQELSVTDETDLATKLAGPDLPNQDANKSFGLLVLPIDFCIGEAPPQAPNIIQIAQVQKQLPTFFPIPDWAYQTAPAQTPAFGAYGVSQYYCGKFAGAFLVDQILWQNANPGSLGTTVAPDALFQFVLNQTAANNLGIRLPNRVRRHVIP